MEGGQAQPVITAEKACMMLITLICRSDCASDLHDMLGVMVYLGPTGGDLTTSGVHQESERRNSNCNQDSSKIWV